MLIQSQPIRNPDSRKQVDVPTSHLDSLARDCLRFSMHFFQPIQQSAQHIYHSALPLSPKSSMFSSMSLPEQTGIMEFYGRPDDWGSVVRSIARTPGRFTSVTVIGRRSAAKIAAACDDGTVGIYDSITGVLRLSLYPPSPIQTITGSPDGSILFFTHQEDPSITLWDIQTGGIICSFTLKAEARDTAISLNGRFLACGLSDGTVNVWEVENKTHYPLFEGGGPPIICLCWLEPEERLMVANQTSVHIRDVVTGVILVHSFNTQGPICGVAFSQRLHQLVVGTSLGSESSITTIDARTGAFSGSCRFRRRLSCFAFSQTGEELVCGIKPRGLETFNISTSRWTYFDFPATITSISTLSNGTVVVNVAATGIQLLGLNKGPVPSEQPIPPAFAVHSLDHGRIISIVPTDRDRVILLETDTMSQFLTIPAPKNLPAPIDHTVVLCASLENKIAVHHFSEGSKEHLQLWRPGSQYPQWTVQGDEPTLAGGISPDCARLVTFHSRRLCSQNIIRIWDVHNGGLQAELNIGCCPHPIDITFDSEDLFYVHHGTYHVSYVVTPTLKSTLASHSIIRRPKISIAEEFQEEQYHVDSSHEWVVFGPQKICWIPPGYIRSGQASYCWAGSSLVMVGQGGTLRKITFLE